MPAELALIPVIESEYNAHDKSSVGATGLWQLMPQTAKELGVKVSKGYDGRVNVIASTKAALLYFRDLGNLFKGNWNLAIAAYNCGQGGVSSAVRKAKSHDFFKLHLPLETKLYVPRLLAVAAIIKHPEKYGIELPQIKDEPFFTEVKINKAVNLSTYSKSTGIDLDTLKKLNPEYKYQKINLQSSHTLLVPITTHSI